MALFSFGSSARANVIPRVGSGGSVIIESPIIQVVDVVVEVVEDEAITVVVLGEDD